MRRRRLTAVAMTLAAAVAAVAPGTEPAAASHFIGPATPEASINTFQREGDTLRVTGWAFDYDAPVDPLRVVVTADAMPVAEHLADLPRPDVQALFARPDHPVGPDHGFDFTVPYPQGEPTTTDRGRPAHAVCITVKNVGDGFDWTDCRRVPASGPPIGALDRADRGGGSLHVEGWAADPDVDAPLEVRVVIDGIVVQTVTADLARSDMRLVALPPEHGFVADVPIPPGARLGCVVAANVGPGEDAQLGCRQLQAPWLPMPPNVRVVDVTATAQGDGYYVLGSDGSVYNFGAADFYGSLRGVRLNQPVVAIAAAEAGGYFIVARDGGVFTFGAASFAGSLAGVKLNAPIVRILTYGDFSYFLLGADGGVFTFGESAHFFGSGVGIVRGRAVGLTTIGSGYGYAIVYSDGRIARFDGRPEPVEVTPPMPLRAPIVDAESNGNNGGAVLAAADGGVFTVDSSFYGSAATAPLPRPVVGLTTIGSVGYVLVTSDGRLLRFGETPPVTAS